MITRMAPSPTGRLHIGTVRTALYNYLYAHVSGGQFYFRIEDTDFERSTKESEKEIIDGLHNIGIDRDAGPDKPNNVGPFRQSERLEIYKKYVDLLLQEGKAYYAYETEQELEAMRNDAMAHKKPFVYKKREYSSSDMEKFTAEGRKPVIRLTVPEKKTYTRNDLIKGEVSFTSEQVGDFVIVRSDGIPTYNFCVVIDDHLMNITHVVRGEDHVSNTPKQMAVYEALGFEIPIFGHLPIILSPNKTKMSKRNEDGLITSMEGFREAGFVKDAVINFIALLGWHPTGDKEFFTLEDLKKEFSIEKVQSSNAIYDFKRALFFNSEHIKNMESSAFINELLSYLDEYGGEEWKYIHSVSREYLLDVAKEIQPRLQTLLQFKESCHYFFKSPQFNPSLLPHEKMGVTVDTVKEILPSIIDSLSSIEFSHEKISETLVELIARHGLKNGQVLWPIRVILTAQPASPGAFEMLRLLGKKESLHRLTTALTILSSGNVG